MIVYSNTTPFIALASIGQLELLPQLFGKVHVAESVIEECAEGGRILVPDLRTLDWVIPVADEREPFDALSDRYLRAFESCLKFFRTSGPGSGDYSQTPLEWVYQC